MWRRRPGERLRQGEASQSVTTIDATVTCKDGSTVDVEFFAALVGNRNVVVFIPRPGARAGDVPAGADDSLMAMCAWCKRVRDAETVAEWESFEQWLLRKVGTRPTHGICPACLGQYFSRSPAAG